MSHVSTVLPDRALITISGADASDWLQGLVTQTVPAFGSATQAHSAFLTPQGRVLGEMIIVAVDDALVLDVDRTFRDALIPRLSLYKLRAKVEIAPIDGVVMAGWGGPAPTGAFVDPRLETLGWRALSPVAGPGGADLSDYTQRRRSLGVAEIAADGLVDRVYAVEANFDLLNGVDFHKGCFIGQETTSRMYRRGRKGSRFDGVLLLHDPLRGHRRRHVERRLPCVRSRGRRRGQRPAGSALTVLPARVRSRKVDALS